MESLGWETGIICGRVEMRMWYNNACVSAGVWVRSRITHLVSSWLVLGLVYWGFRMNGCMISPQN